MKTLCNLVVAAPIFHSDKEPFIDTQNIIIRTETEGATIYYTLDGTEPTTSSMVYTTPISVSSTTTIKAFATSSGMVDSYISTATYTNGGTDLVSTKTDIRDNDFKFSEPLSTHIKSDDEDRVFGVENAIVVRSNGVSFFSIYDLSGQLVNSGVANIGETYIDALTGTYRVSIDNETFKIQVK